jgi:hypothetical protein
LPTRVSELFYDLESKGYIEIKNRHSQYRRIYYRPKSKVEDILLSTKSDSENILLTTFAPSTFDKSRNITKESNNTPYNPPKGDGSEFVSSWNSKERLPKIKTLTDKRRKALKVRMSEKQFAQNLPLFIEKSAACEGAGCSLSQAYS